jgi:hypothetical protein
MHPNKAPLVAPFDALSVVTVQRRQQHGQQAGEVNKGNFNRQADGQKVSTRVVVCPGPMTSQTSGKLLSRARHSITPSGGGI